MNINRHNYEAYFILYMDNELGSADRSLVEEFIQKNPDLKEELEILLQYKLIPDTSIVFDNKEELMVQAGKPMISPDNYEEWLVLYLDNELSSEQRTLVEQFVAAYPPVKEELAMLQQTKLQPDEIIFANKESLYKREEKVRVIPIRRRSIAAAAVLILAAGIGTVILLNKRSVINKNEVAKVTGTEQKAYKENTPVIKNEEKNQIPLPVIANNSPNKVASSSAQINNNAITKRNNVVINKRLSKNIPYQVKKEEPVVVEKNNKPSNNLPQPPNYPNLKDDGSKNSIASIKIPAEIKQPATITGNPVTNTTEQPYNNKNPDASFASLEEGGKNKKNRGFLRKAVRFIEKKTNINATDDEQLLVGGLAFKLK